MKLELNKINVKEKVSSNIIFGWARRIHLISSPPFCFTRANISTLGNMNKQSKEKGMECRKGHYFIINITFRGEGAR
jgi:hypothetical protein